MRVDIVGTEDFFDPMSTTKLNSIQSFCSDVWQSEVEDGSGNYEINNWEVHNSFSFEIPEEHSVYENKYTGKDDDHIGTYIKERQYNSEMYLQLMAGWYDDSDAIIVADYFSSPNPTWGVSWQSTAGEDIQFMGMVNVQKEGTVSWPSHLDNVGIEGTAAHELGHVFNAVHTQASSYSTFWGDDELTLMHSEGDSTTTQCNYDGDWDMVIDEYSDCTLNGTSYGIRTHIDQM